jgi:hypothetical protein
MHMLWFKTNEMLQKWESFLVCKPWVMYRAFTNYSSSSNFPECFNLDVIKVPGMYRNVRLLQMFFSNLPLKPFTCVLTPGHVQTLRNTLWNGLSASICKWSKSLLDHSAHVQVELPHSRSGEKDETTFSPRGTTERDQEFKHFFKRVMIL